MVETLLNSRVGVVYRLVVRRAGRDIARDALVFHDYKRAVSHVATAVRRHATPHTPDAVLLQRGTLNGGSVRRLGLDALHWTELECWGPEVVQRIITQDRMWNPPAPREAEPQSGNDLLRGPTGAILCPPPRALPPAAPAEVAVTSPAPVASAAASPEPVPSAVASPAPVVVAIASPAPAISVPPAAAVALPVSPTPVAVKPHTNGGAAAAPTVKTAAVQAGPASASAAKASVAKASVARELAELEQLSKHWYKSRGWYLVVATVIIAATWLAVVLFMTGGRPDVVLRNYFAPQKTEAPPADIGFDGTLLHGNGNGRHE